MTYRIYLDVCCLNRPFDDWIQPRIRLEAEAILAILEQCESSNWSLMGSKALDAEISRTPDPIRKQRLIDSLALVETRIAVTETMVQRATELTNFSLKAFDALHIACAEAIGADIFLTTDDRLLRKATQYQANISVRVANPVAWFMEVSKSQGEE